MSNDTLREELDRLDKAATPGKLYAIGRYLSTRPSITHSPDHIDELGEDRDSGRFQAVPFHRAEDAELLASLRNAVPQILEAITTNRAQVEEIEKLKAELDGMTMDAAVGFAIIAAWRGEPVSDFMQSFPDVMDAMWGHAQMKELRRD